MTHEKTKRIHVVLRQSTLDAIDARRNAMGIPFGRQIDLAIAEMVKRGWVTLNTGVDDERRLHAENWGYCGGADDDR